MNSDATKFGAALRKRSKGRAVVRDKEAAVASILSAAEVEFARYGLHGARVEAIAKNAGVTKGLIFHYFRSKAHLFEEVLRNASEPIKAAVVEVENSEASAREQLQTLVDRFLDVSIHHPLAHLIFTLESIQNHGEHYRKLHVPSLFTAIERVLAKGIKEGCFRNLDATHAAINIVGLCNYYFSAVNIHPDPNLRRDPWDKKRLARHVREVKRFIEGSTTCEKNNDSARFITDYPDSQ